MADTTDRNLFILPEDKNKNLSKEFVTEINYKNATSSSNKTENIEFGIPLDRKIIYQAVAITLSLVVLYVSFALLLYNWLRSDCNDEQRGRKRSTLRRDGTAKRGGGKDSGGTSDSSNSNATTSCRSKSSSARNSRILRIMCVCASILTFLRLLSEQIEILPGDENRLDCRDYQIAMVVTYALAITMLYAILWYRVRVFLAHPAMRHLGSKVLTVIAFIVLGIVVIASVMNSIMFLVTTISEDAYGGCMVISPGDVLSNDKRFAILTVSTVVSQSSLLGLFLYPLVRHSASMRKISTPKPSRAVDDVKRTQSLRSTLTPGTLRRNWRNRNSSRKQKREQALLKIIRRVMITAIICTVSDIFCGLIVRLVVEQPRIVTNLIFDVNLVVNLACVLMSFKDWRVRMFPCCITSQKSREESVTYKRPVSSKDKPIVPPGPPTTSSPAVFTSRDSSGTGVYPTSESGVNSPMVHRNYSQSFDKSYSHDHSVSEDFVKPT